ncbi:flagellar regulatory protein FleQ [Vibrio ponticus]|nr:flagellar regulatory protein FleQ [Vibrio ponticus]
MQGLAKLLVIEDDAQAQTNLATILDFVGEQCEVVSAAQIDSLDFAGIWSGCIVGSINDADDAAKLNDRLSSASHIPLLIANSAFPFVEDLTNYVGDLAFPLNYPQLSEALRHCKDFLGRKGSMLLRVRAKIRYFAVWSDRAMAFKKFVI